MKRLFVIGVGALTLTAWAACARQEGPAEETAPAEVAEAPEASDRGKAEIAIAGKRIAIDYGRPALQGRDMLGEATPGLVWRLGMNEATTLSTEASLQLGETTLPPGDYSLFAKYVGSREWTLLVNSETGLWGAYDYQEEKDVARVPLEVSEETASVERFTIELRETGESSGELSMAWGPHRLKVPFRVEG